MRVSYLHCVKCRCRYSPHNAPQRCGCGGSIIVQYDWSGFKINWKSLRARPFNHLRYNEFYPPFKEIISLGEGGTPVINSVSSQSWHFKIEGSNPTGSVKDRGSSIEVSGMKENGVKRVVIASSGHSGLSLAAYCARAGIHCDVVIPSTASKRIIQEIQDFGADAKTVSGDCSAATAKAVSVSIKENIPLAGNYSYRREGEKSVSFELIDQLGELDYIIAPMGDGSLIASMWRGCKDLCAARLLYHMPRLVGVQSEGCCPIVRAFATDSRIRKVTPRGSPRSISCGDPLDGDLAIQSVKESEGGMVAVSGLEIARAEKTLSEKEGIDADPAAASTLAAAIKLKIPKTAKVAFVVAARGDDLD